MAHTRQQEKRNRQTKELTIKNTAQKSRMRSTVKKLETTIAAGKSDDILSSFKAAMSQMARAASRGLISKKAAARKTSRLAARINSSKASA